MLVLEKLIGRGAARECYEHPLDPGKCVKVSNRRRGVAILDREIRHYPYIESILNDFVVGYGRELVETDKGPGLVCELLRDDGGKVSESLVEYAKNNAIDQELKQELSFFVYNLFAHDLFFYDFNLKNFVVQIRKGEKKLKYIDLKSFENYKPWTFLKLEKIVAPLARRIMARRLKRLYRSLSLPFPSRSE